LLRTTDLSIGEVAQQCGYQVESTFYRLFKKFYNISPGQYRRMGGL
jgi:AraC-like DNA-binding protein